MFTNLRSHLGQAHKDDTYPVLMSEKGILQLSLENAHHTLPWQSSPSVRVHKEIQLDGWGREGVELCFCYIFYLNFKSF